MQGKAILLIIVIAFFPLVLFAQDNVSMNTGLIKQLEKNPTSSESVSLLVKGNPRLIQEKTTALGGNFKYVAGNICCISIPLNRVSELLKINSENSSERAITSIEGYEGKGIALDDMTFVNADVTPVQQGVLPLAQPYDGKGVVVAILDVGIDFHHPDFINEDGTTRIKYLWDQNATTGGVVPQPYNYGQEWNSAAIDAGNCTHVEPPSEFGHGSNVSGIAAGNGLAIHNYYGVAPASDMIVVAVNLDDNFLNNLVDATKYVYDKAASMQEPCVINVSLGTYFGSHDGFDLAAEAIDSLIVAQSGRSFVAAAGNGGNIPFHLGYEADADSSFTWFKYAPSLKGVFYEWWINKKDAANFNFALGADISAPMSFLGRTRYFNLVKDFDFSLGQDSLIDTLSNGAAQIGIVHLYAFETDSTYACDVFIEPNNISDYWRFITNGNGRFDLWSGSTTTGTSDMINSSLPDSNSFHDIVRYKLPDTRETLVSSFTCSDKVITVANFTNRHQYIDVNGNLQIFITDTTGKLAVSSSFGPTRDGRLKPDIAAPGNRTITTCNLLTLAGLIQSAPAKVALGGMHDSNGGTSMASPVVAGIAALYLQKNPTANWKMIKDAILLSAKKDFYTGNDLPNDAWGYGKADAFAAMISNITYGCTDPSSVNYDPDATVDDGSCNNISGFSPLQNESISIQCAPNPFHSSSDFYFQSPLNERSKIIITDIFGKQVISISLSTAKGSVPFKSELAPGIYFYQLCSENRVLITKKMLVY